MIYQPHDWQAPFEYYRQAGIRHQGVRRIMTYLDELDARVAYTQNAWGLEMLLGCYGDCVAYALHRRWSKPL